MIDPFKELTRKYDRAVCAKGGTSIFGQPYAIAGVYQPVGRLGGRPPGPPSQDGQKLTSDEIRAISARRHKTNNPGGQFQGPKPSAFRKNAQVSAHYIPSGWDDET